ncbi:MAG: hypothetical protein ACXVWU_00190 [Nocardioides sp.]
MKKPLIRVALASVVAGVVLLPTAAFAQAVTVTDPKKDSWEQTQDPATGAITYTQAGSAPNSDITSVRVRHTTGRVIVRTNFVSLAQNGQGVVLEAAIRTDEGLRRNAWVVKDPAKAGYVVVLHKPTGAAVGCSGLTGSIDWAGDAVVVSVPRSCLSAPRWVRVAVGAGNYGDSTRRSYLDMAGTTGHSLTFTGRIRKG